MNFILGTAGHIDHGKSTLVKCLTGSDPDRLPEEKKRGVTIELGFAHLSLPGPKETFEIGVVDVPGHADFINNMVAGVASLDLALFVVAADDAWMPQSEEHLQILSYLGIKNFLIALTKADLVEDLDFVSELLRDDLQGTLLADAQIIPVSAHTGQGIDDLKVAIAKNLAKTAAPRDFGQPRLAIDRVFSPKGVGTVVTGTLTGGSLSVGEQITAHPDLLRGNVRTIQNHNSSIPTALPGMRTALNLSDLPIATRGKKGLHRGDLLVGGKSKPGSDTIDVLIERSARAIPGQKGHKRALRTDQRYLIHHGSGHSPARLRLPDSPRLHAGDSALAQLRFDHPVNVLAGEKLVIRDLSRDATLAGATVLDPHGDRRALGREDQQEFLQKRAAAPDDMSVLLSSLIVRDRLLTQDLSAHALPFAPGKIAATLKKLAKTGGCLLFDNHLAASNYWKELTQKASATIRECHLEKPDEPGLPLTALQKKLGSLISVPNSFAALLDWLAKNNHRVSENIVCHQDHSLELPPALEAAASGLMALFDSSGLQPPNLKDVLTSPNHEAAYKFLTRTRQLLPLDPKVTISAETFRLAKERVGTFIQKNGPATASNLRQHLDTSRKILMPLLERLDRDKITKRDGDFRTLGQ